MYHVTYKTPSDAAESTRNTIDHLNDEAPPRRPPDRSYDLRGP